ncbi:uncharacterized protein J3R85_017155 [Psidium guajava]|nr:uncharacterized protein J3R85_017155 [Psidium guajava]
MDLIHLDRFPDILKSLVHTVAELPMMVPDSFCNSRFFCKLTDLCSQLLIALLRPSMETRLILLQRFRNLCPHQLC